MESYDSILAHLSDEQLQEKNDKEEYIMSKVYENFGVKYTFSKFYKGYKPMPIRNAVDVALSNAEKDDINKLVEKECHKVEVLMDMYDLKFDSKVTQSTLLKTYGDKASLVIDNRAEVKDYVKSKRVFLEQKYKPLLDAVKENQQNKDYGKEI